METEEDITKMVIEKLEELVVAEGSRSIDKLQIEIKLLQKILGV